MNKKRLFALIMAVCLMLSLCACGTSKNNDVVDDSSSVNSNQQEQVTPDADAGNEDEDNSATTDYEITDMLGRTVTIPADTTSYACIGPGALRLYCYVADDAELAGVEDVEQTWGDDGRPYNMSIPNVNELPVIGPGGPGNAPDAEMLFVAAPDVIFTCYNTDIASVEELQDKTGIPVVAISYGEGRLFDQTLYDSLSLIGKITDHEERAQEVINYFEVLKADLETRVVDVEPIRVYLGGQSSRGSHGIESTTGDYEIFNVLTATNVVNEKDIYEYIMLDKEALLELDPEVIILDAGGLSLVQEDYVANPEYYDSLSAFKNGKVYLQMPFNYYTTNMEIALADAYYIGSVLYPEAFADVDPVAKFDEISNFFLGIDSYDRISSVYYGGFQQVTLDQ